MTIKGTRSAIKKFTVRMFKHLRTFRRSFLIITAFNLLVVFPLVVGISFAATTSVQTSTNSTSTSTTSDFSSGLGMLGAGLAIAGSCIGAGIAVGYAASAGIAAIVEKPSAFGFVLILAGLGEGIAIYGLLIAFQILAKIP
ncbi:MAG: ATP synthase subunit C [Nitrososphaeria archaeon]|jgi:V/A-type H+-transporting ATPase subunit K